MRTSQQPLGRVWAQEQWKNFYTIRRIKRGRRKGWVEVQCVVGVGRKRKFQVQINAVRFQEVTA